MPLQQIITTWFALNGSNDDSPSGVADLRTGAAVFAGGLNAGDYFDLTEQEANEHSYDQIGILHAGRYRRVQLSPQATVANQGVGKLGFMPTLLVPELNIVTTQDLGVAAGRIVVFLNVVDPGKYCFVQELGIATVNLSGAVAAAGPVSVGAAGIAAPGSTSPIGYALGAVTAAGPGLVLLNLPVVQG